MKKNIVKLSNIILIIIVIITLPSNKIKANAKPNLKINELEINYEELYNNDFYSSFDNHEIKTSKRGFTINLYKTHNNINLNGISSNNLLLKYKIDYLESAGIIEFRIVAQEIDVIIIDTYPTYITNNDDEVDLLCPTEEDIVYASEVEEKKDEENFWGKFTSFFKTTNNFIKELFVNSIKFSLELGVNVIGLNNGAKILNMYEDNDGIYHADFDCWQQYAGYNDLYDNVFNEGTIMDKTRHEFYDKNNDGLYDFVLWGWKGDYWELGLGGELGIYRRVGKTNLWYIDTDYAIEMTIKVYFKQNNDWNMIIDWNPMNYFDNNYRDWWITAFNPKYKGLLTSKDDIQVTYDIKFNMNTFNQSINDILKNEFKESCVGENSWMYNYISESFTLTF